MNICGDKRSQPRVSPHKCKLTVGHAGPHKCNCLYTWRKKCK